LKTNIVQLKILSKYFFKLSGSEKNSLLDIVCLKVRPLRRDA